jgi:hypothetical protein
VIRRVGGPHERLAVAIGYGHEFAKNAMHNGVKRGVA